MTDDEAWERIRLGLPLNVPSDIKKRIERFVWDCWEDDFRRRSGLAPANRAHYHLRSTP